MVAFFSLVWLDDLFMIIYAHKNNKNESVYWRVTSNHDFLYYVDGQSPKLIFHKILSHVRQKLVHFFHQNHRLRHEITNFSDACFLHTLMRQFLVDVISVNVFYFILFIFFSELMRWQIRHDGAAMKQWLSVNRQFDLTIIVFKHTSKGGKIFIGPFEI